jgi:chitinase
MRLRLSGTTVLVTLAWALASLSACGSSSGSGPSGAAGAAGDADTSAGGTSAGGTSAGGTSAGGTSAGGTSAGGTSAGGTSAGGSAGAAGAGGGAGAGGSTGASGKWSMGYYASWQANQYAVSDVDWAGLTHLAVAFYEPQSDGSVQLLGQNPSVAAQLVQAAHAHGVKAIASIGGANSGPDFQAATKPGVIDAFVASLTALLNSPGYDGLDFDWEPLTNADEPTVVNLAERVRTAHSGVILTIPIGYVNPNAPPDLSGYTSIAGAFDQLNIMTYGMAGAWQGWKSWHSSAIYQTDSATPLSVDSSVQAYLAAGVPAAKLGIGIGFFGLCYSPPVTAPDQALGSSTVLAGDGTMSFAHIMGSYYSANARQWDSLALVPYLSFGSAHAPEGCSYISYDDAQSIQQKGKYIKSKNLGGVIEWEINEGYLSSAAAGQQNPLLDAVHDDVLQ